MAGEDRAAPVCWALFDTAAGVPTGKVTFQDPWREILYPKTPPRISIIIPTTAERSREAMLERAISSTLSQERVAAQIIVVVNGDRFDGPLVARLRSDPRLVVIQRYEGNVSAARYEGLIAATGEFFCFLDDDDEFLPGALALRAALFTADADVVVTNGFLDEGSGDAVLVPAAVAARANADPASSFLRFNWFASPGSMFRTATVPPTLFDMRLRHFEWTRLFFALLAAGKVIRFYDCPTFRKFEHAGSVSRSLEYMAAYPAFLRELMTLDLNPAVRRALKAKYRTALNALSRLEMRRRRRLAAWLAHLRCLLSGGWQYLPYTRHLLR